MRGWALGAVLWIASQILGLVFARAGIGDPNLRGSGVVAFGMMGRGILVVVVALIVAVSNPEVALAGALVYAAAYSTELALSLTSYFGGRAAPMNAFLLAALERVRPGGGVRAPSVDLDRDRPDRPLREQGGRLHLARRARHDPARDLGHALRPLAAPGPAPDGRRGHLRRAPGPDLRGQPAEEGGLGCGSPTAPRSSSSSGC